MSETGGRRGATLREGARLEVAFEGSPGHVRSFNYGDEFGLLLHDVDPDEALDLLAADARPRPPWDALGDALRELADAGLTGPEILAFLATRRCGFDEAEWAEAIRGAEGTVETNARHGARKWREAVGEARE